jgi:hypothetical protein
VRVAVHGDRAHVVRGVELLDCSATEHATGHLLLGVGLDPRAPGAAEAALRVAVVTESVLAVKYAGQDFLDRACSVGVTVVVVDPDVPWSRLQRLASTRLATRADDTELAGNDLFSLANSVAAIVGGAVAIMDTSQTILAYSNLPGQPIDETRRRGILGRRVPQEALPDHLAEEVWRSESVVRHHRDGDLPRAAMVIRAGDEVLGSLWAAFADDARIAGCEPALRHAASVAALHMLALRRQLDADENGRNLALRAALEQPGSYSVALPLPAVLLGVTPRTTSSGTNLLRLLDLLAADGRSLGYQPALALVNDRIYALLPVASGGVVSLGAFVAHVRDRADRALHVNVSLVRGGRVDTLSELSSARRDVDSALDHLRAEGAAPGAYTTDELRAELVRQRLLQAVRSDPLLRWGIGDRVRDHDREHGSAFRITMLAYLRHFGDVNAASAELTIHQNTLRQRLRRAQELFGLALDNPAQRLTLEIELAASG